MEGEGAAAGPPRRGAGQNQAPHPVGVPHHQVLRDHAPEGNPDDQGVVPAQGVHQSRRVVGIVGHGIGTVGLLRLAQTPLVIGHEVEGPGKGTVEHVRADPKVASGSGNEQQPRALANAFIVDVEAVGGDFGHGQSLWIGSIQRTSRAGSTGSMSRFTTTASPSLRTRTHSRVSSEEALISWCGTKGGT